MAAALGDVLLVLLSREPRTVVELQEGYTDIFGDKPVMDVIRIGGALTRLERRGYVRTAIRTEAAATGSRVSSRRRRPDGSDSRAPGTRSRLRRSPRSAPRRTTCAGPTRIAMRRRDR